MRKSGISPTAMRVTSQDKRNIETSTRAQVSAFDTTEVRSVLIACWESTTSVFSLLTSEPVWVRVKNATGCRWTCTNTCVRRSYMTPWLIRDEYQPWMNVSV